MIQAVLGNPGHPEYGVATIPFPISHDQYAYCMELLEALEIGDAVKADCKVEEIDSFYTVLKRMETLTVNVEELNYLAKRLESFDDGEAAQFQAMAHKLELSKLKDFINLTFCCQQTTVITDFSDLAAIGRDHYMNLHGGSARVDELEALDGEETARQLIENGNGTITPYGVAYDNGIKLEQVYDGQFFPCYYYEPNASALALTSKAEPEDTEHITWLFLPMAQEEIDRALLRAGITDPPEIRLRLVESHLPDEVDVLLDTTTTHTCTFSISCETILDNMDKCVENKKFLVPADGIVFPATEVEFSEGESVFDVLQRVCRDNAIHMESNWTPMYNSAYVEGINNLYEFDVGSLSGWMYNVNGWYPNYGCSRYQLKDGDVVEWRYTCDLGYDLGSAMGG